MFDKKVYWERRKNTVTRKDEDGNDAEVSKPLRGQGNKPVTMWDSITQDQPTMSFTNEGTLFVNNRATRRKPTRLSLKSSQLRKKNKRNKK